MHLSLAIRPDKIMQGIPINQGRTVTCLPRCSSKEQAGTGTFIEFKIVGFLVNHDRLGH